jgi:hypothetical protein
MLARFTFYFSMPLVRVSLHACHRNEWPMSDSLQSKSPGVHETDARFGVVGVCCEFIPFTARH